LKQLLPQDLQRFSDLIVVGEVKELYTTEQTYEDGTITTRYAIGVRVERVEKGEGPKPGDLVFVRSFGTSFGYDRVGDSGPGAPQVGSHVKLFARRDDGGYAVLTPNGIEWLTGQPVLVSRQKDSWQELALRLWPLLAVGVVLGGVAGAGGGWWMGRMKR
jgi:hypothetical protein